MELKEQKKYDYKSLNEFTNLDEIKKKLEEIKKENNDLYLENKEKIDLFLDNFDNKDKEGLN